MVARSTSTRRARAGGALPRRARQCLLVDAACLAELSMPGEHRAEPRQRQAPQWLGPLEKPHQHPRPVCGGGCPAGGVGDAPPLVDDLLVDPEPPLAQVQPPLRQEQVPPQLLAASRLDERTRTLDLRCRLPELEENEVRRCPATKLDERPRFRPAPRPRTGPGRATPRPRQRQPRRRRSDDPASRCY